VGPFAVALAFPFYWMVITAFKKTNELYNLSRFPFWWHGGLPQTTANVSDLFNHTDYPRWLANTAFVGGMVVLITLLLALPAGYALARLSGRWGQSMGVAIFLTYLVPPTLLFLPLSRVISELHLHNSLWSLVLVYPSFTVPFATWLLMGFFQDDSAGARGSGPDRRRLARRRSDTCRLPDLAAGDPDRGDLLVLARRERVRVRDHLHLELAEPHALGRSADGADPRRSRALGVDHGRTLIPAFRWPCSTTPS